jgi:hypothetical protein
MPLPFFRTSLVFSKHLAIIAGAIVRNAKSGVTTRQYPIALTTYEGSILTMTGSRATETDEGLYKMRLSTAWILSELNVVELLTEL